MKIDCIELKQLGFHIANPVYDFLIDTNSEEMWQGRGLSGHDQNFELIQKLERQREQAIRELQESEAGKKRIADFSHEVREVMKAILLGHYDWLDGYLGERQFIILCGLHRSGGTYLLDELSSIYSYPYQKYHCMHDDIPEFFSALYWNVPHHYLQYICEVAQFLVIVRQSVPWKVVVKKRAIWTFAIESLAYIFRKRMTIYLHVRHPISWAVGDTELRDGKGSGITVVPSMKQYVEYYDRPLRGNETPCQIMMRFWLLFHTTSARKGVDYSVLPFGNYGNHLIDLAKVVKPNYTPSAFTPTPRDYSQYSSHYAEAEDIIQQVRSHWANLGLTFPKLDLI